MDDDDLDAEGLSPLQAYGAVRRFAQRCGTLPMRLALHAALPQVLHADLLHLLRLNFVDDGRANPVAEADVLFADFCSELGHAYFRIDPHARALLLAELDGAYPAERRHRSLQVAEFLLAWFDHELAGERAGTDAMYRSWIEVERWSALAFADPDGAAEQLAAVLQHATDPAQAAARLRVGTLARSLAQPLAKHQPLLDYAAGMQALQAQSHETAQALLRRVGDRPVQVGAVQLPPPRQVLSRLAASVAPAAPVDLADPADAAAPAAAAEPAPQPPAGAAAPEAAGQTPARAAPQGGSYSAYISHAHQDDQLWNGWVGDFARELERGLRAVLRGQPLAPLHLPKDLVPNAGLVDEALAAQVGASLAMIVIVGDAYVQSPWGLREIELFAQRFGAQAMQDRLYLVALSEPAMRTLQDLPAWQRLGLADHVWLPFYDPARPGEPIPVYADRERVSPGFRSSIERLRSDLASKLRRTAREAPPPPPPADGRTEVAVGVADAAGSPRLSIGVVAMAEARGLRVQQVPLADLALRGQRALARAQQLVLPFDNQPLGADGGHLAMFRDAWQALGRDDTTITWLDMRTADDSRRSTGAARWVQSLGVHVQGVNGWLGGLDAGAPVPPAAPAPQPAPAVRVYVESNMHERTHWEALGGHLQQHWAKVTADLGSGAPAPRLQVRGLPVDQLEHYPSLDDADGVLLLWGRKTSDALVAQINRVENKLAAGREAPPGLVAMLIPPQHASEPVPAWGWPVLRFETAGGDEALTVADHDAAELREFLRQALRFHLRRQGGPA